MIGIGRSRAVRGLAAGMAGVILLACARTVPKDAFLPKGEVLANRRLQTRRFDTDERTLLKASAGVLQDLGFIVDETNPDVGLISCSKKRDARDARQIIVGFLAMFLYQVPHWDVDQVIRVSVATNPVPSSEGGAPVATAVRVTFLRIVTKADNTVRRESINNPDIYRVFFEKLSQSLFLEAQEI